MEGSYLGKSLRFIFALPFCFVALFLPYRARMFYIGVLAFLFHLPFVLFGKITRYFFKKLEIDPNDIDWV